MKSERIKVTCEREHEMKAREHVSVQQKITAISKDIPKTLTRAKYEFSVCVLFHKVLCCVNDYQYCCYCIRICAVVVEL